MDKAELAVAKHRNGYNCCQAVACVFADEVGIDESLLYKMGEGFGAGMGTAQGVCGAISGAAMIAGLVHSDGNTEMAGQTKAKTTRIAGIMQRKFVEQAKALICKDIKTPPETVMSYWRNHCRCPDPDDSVDITGDRKAVGTALSAVSVSGFTQQIAFHFTKKGISVSVYASGSSTCSILLRQSVPIAAQTSGDSSRP